MSDDIPFEDHNHAIQELQTKLDEAQDMHDRHNAQLAKQHDAKITRKVAEAIAKASALKTIPSPLRPQKFRPVLTPLKSSSSILSGFYHCSSHGGEYIFCLCHNSSIGAGRGFAGAGRTTTTARGGLEQAIAHKSNYGFSHTVTKRL